MALVDTLLLCVLDLRKCVDGIEREALQRNDIGIIAKCKVHLENENSIAMMWPLLYQQHWYLFLVIVLGNDIIILKYDSLQNEKTEKTYSYNKDNMKLFMEEVERQEESRVDLYVNVIKFVHACTDKNITRLREIPVHGFQNDLKDDHHSCGRYVMYLAEMWRDIKGRTIEDMVNLMVEHARSIRLSEVNKMLVHYAKGIWRNSENTSEDTESNESYNGETDETDEKGTIYCMMLKLLYDRYYHS
ncbi:MAG: hypothetical protein Q8Q60_05645 [Candidatus Chromulinivorax sp.]|nr:hypothetical protein [Candidatus Chromulinivorax sp.]